MKNFCIIHILLFLICMLVVKCSTAQDYLVTNKGDTVRGELKLLFFGSDKKIQVTDANRKKTTYNIFQTRSAFANGEIYQPQKGPSGYAFMKLVKPGFLSLYSFQQPNQNTYDGLLLAKKDGTSMEVPNLGFKKSMAKFLSDCESVSAEIDQGELTKRDLNSIIDEYNQCVERKSKRIEQQIASRTQKATHQTAWDNLGEKVKAQPDFEGKASATEMIEEIKNKLSRSEKIPNFMIEGLKSTLSSQESLKEDLDKALAEIPAAN